MKSCGRAQLRTAGNQEMANAVILETATQEAGLNGVAGEGLRQRCRQHRTEVLSCRRTWNGLE